MSVHLPVMLEEAMEALAIRDDGAYVDCTFGRGGHSRALLQRLGPRGRLLALDRDPQAIAAAREISDTRFRAIHAPMSTLGRVISEFGLGPVHGVLADLGLSTPQLEEAGRGFSFRHDGPLDMRMDPTRGEPAANWLARASEPEIREVLGTYGQERFAKQVAAAIVAARRLEPIRRTRQLADLVGAAVRTREPGQDPATRSFQALRILVNRELEEVSLMLDAALANLAPGGRLAVISFHSLEDRIVKRAFAAAGRPEIPRDLPLRASEMPRALLTMIGRARRPGEAELRRNPRSRSATLRVAERSAVPLRSGPSRPNVVV